MALTVKKEKLNKSFEYTPITEKGTDSPFTVQFDALSLEALATLQDDAIKVSKDGGYSVSINSLNYAVLKTSLTGWSNVESDTGPIRFKRDNTGATENTLALVPADMRSELATIIVEVSKDLPNAESYLEQLDKLAEENGEEEAQDSVATDDKK